MTESLRGVSGRHTVAGQREGATSDVTDPAGGGRGRRRRILPRSRRLRALLATATAGLGVLGAGTLQPYALAVGGPTAKPSFNNSVGKIQSAKGSCTGTIIKPFLLMTAKHCKISDGSTITFFQYDGGGASPITGTIQDVRTHPTRDFAMSKVHFADTSSLPSASDLNFETQTKGAQVTSIGYGWTDYGGGEEHRSDFQLQAVGQINGQSLIDIQPGQYYETTGFRFCAGDSGGPLLDSSGRVVAVMGVSSRGSGKCGDEGYGLKLDEVKGFIQGTCRELGGGTTNCYADPPAVYPVGISKIPNDYRCVRLSITHPIKNPGQPQPPRQPEIHEITVEPGSAERGWTAIKTSYTVGVGAKVSADAFEDAACTVETEYRGYDSVTDAYAREKLSHFWIELSKAGIARTSTNG